jgi:hypothetical protein
MRSCRVITKLARRECRCGEVKVTSTKEINKWKKLNLLFIEAARIASAAGVTMHFSLTITAHYYYSLRVSEKRETSHRICNHSHSNDEKPFPLCKVCDVLFLYTDNNVAKVIATFGDTVQTNPLAFQKVIS